MQPAETGRVVMQVGPGVDLEMVTAAGGKNLVEIVAEGEDVASGSKGAGRSAMAGSASQPANPNWPAISSE